jgi:hypothetical protein
VPRSEKEEEDSSEKKEEEANATGQKKGGRHGHGAGMTVGVASAAKGGLEKNRPTKEQKRPTEDMNPAGISRSEGQLKEQVNALKKSIVGD